MQRTPATGRLKGLPWRSVSLAPVPMGMDMAPWRRAALPCALDREPGQSPGLPYLQRRAHPWLRIAAAGRAPSGWDGAGHALMEPAHDEVPRLPDPDWLAQRQQRVAEQLRPWRLLLCTAEPLSRLWVLVSVLQPPRGEPPQRLLGLCRRASEIAGLLPDPASDVLVISQEFLLDGPALPTLRRLLERPAPPTVLLSLATPHRVTVKAAVEAGVRGLISQAQVGRGTVLEAVTHLAQGRPFLDGDCRAALEDAGPGSLELTARELEILRLVAEGCTNRAIAERLQIAEVTARDHVQRILSKLQVPDRTAAAVAGLRLGYLR